MCAERVQQMNALAAAFPIAGRPREKADTLRAYQGA